MIPGQNSNTPAAATTVETHPAWLTQEIWDGLSSKKIPLDSLKPEQQAEFSDFLGKVTSGEAAAPKAPETPAGAPAPETTTPPATPAPEAAAGDIKSPADVPLADPAKREDFFKRYQEKSAEANTVKQLRDQIRQMKAEMDTKMAEFAKRPITQANPDDPLDAASVKSMGEQLALLKEQLAVAMDVFGKQAGALESFHAQGAAQLNEQTALLGLERFQYETQGSDIIPPELGLQTTVPLPMLNAELSSFAARVGGMENVNKYLKDPAYKAQVEGQGVKLSEGFIKNLDKFNLIFDLNEAVKEGKFPDHMAAYSHHLVTSGKLAEALRNAKLAGANAVANGVASSSQSTPTLTPGLDATPKAPGWTVKTAREWLRAHPDIRPGSPEDKTFQEINDLIAKGQIR